MAQDHFDDVDHLMKALRLEGVNYRDFSGRTSQPKLKLIGGRSEVPTAPPPRAEAKAQPPRQAPSLPEPPRAATTIVPPAVTPPSPPPPPRGWRWRWRRQRPQVLAPLRRLPNPCRPPSPA